VARVALNSTVGLLGFIDVATNVGLMREREDFGQTLGVWGFRSGPFLMLPLFGPSSVRDAFGLAADWATDPLVLVPADVPTRNTMIGVRAVDNRASLLAAEQTLGEIALDRYLFLRDAYLARRKSQVDDGATREPPPKDP
jgi:phospholipid-binding lipoprotein MlaA